MMDEKRGWNVYSSLGQQQLCSYVYAKQTETLAPNSIFAASITFAKRQLKGPHCKSCKVSFYAGFEILITAGLKSYSSRNMTQFNPCLDGKDSECLRPCDQ